MAIKPAVTTLESAVGDTGPDRTAKLNDAQTATAREHSMSLWDGLRLYPKAIGWSILLSTAIVMEGYDVILMGSFFAMDSFKEQYGSILPDGSYELSASWQAGLSNAMNCGQILGLFADGIISERIGYRKTMLGALSLVVGLIFILFFAPNKSYVKGAIEYFTTSDFYATGHGVLSGEHYVYQADPATYYQALKNDSTSLRMWWHNNLGGGQTWYCRGPTINAPPFNTMDFSGSSDITTRISDYKQAGAFFFQTDGPEMYPKSQVHNVFLHVNDDAIKVYYPGVTVARATIWKAHNDPIIQMGWDSRAVSGVTLQDISVIHTRYIKSETVVPSAIIGASSFYASGSSVDPNKSISMTISRLVCEGLCPALMRISLLQNYRDFLVQDVAFPDGLQTNSIGTGESLVPASSGVQFGVTISNWTVGGEQVTMQNFQSDLLGQLDVDASYWGQWSIR